MFILRILIINVSIELLSGRAALRFVLRAGLYSTSCMRPRRMIIDDGNPFVQSPNDHIGTGLGRQAAASIERDWDIND